MKGRKIFLGFINAECKENEYKKGVLFIYLFKKTQACMNMKYENAPNVQLYPSPSLKISIVPDAWRGRNNLSNHWKVVGDGSRVG